MLSLVGRRRPVEPGHRAIGMIRYGGRRLGSRGCERKRSSMANYAGLVMWTDQGVRAAKDTLKRLERARDAFRAVGVAFDRDL